MIATVLFDLDGTLLDSLGDLAAAVNNAMSGLSFPLRTRDEVRSFIGNGVPTLIRRSLPPYADDVVHQKAVALFTEYYMKHVSDLTAPFPGIRSLLADLRERRINIGIVSNKRDEATKLVCSKLLGGLCDYAAGARSEQERKPAPDMVFAAMEYFGASAESTLYIGDSEVDIAVAKNAGLDCVSVLWGYRSKAELLQAGGRIFAESPEALGEIILTLRE